MTAAIGKAERDPSSKVAVVLVNWNASDDTLDLLAQLDALEGPELVYIVVDNAYVPEHRTHRFTEPGMGAFESPIYDLPFGNVFALCLCAVTQGIAEAALENYTSYLRQRVHKYDGRAMATDPFQQRRLSDVTADVHANRARFHNVFRRLHASLQSASTVPVEVQVQETWETQCIAHRNADLVTTLMRASGGGAQRLQHPMQRYFRDINAAVAHAFLNTDRGSLQFAQVALATKTD